METFLEYLQFSTAAPFGYAMFYSFWLAVFAISATVILRSIIKKHTWRLRFLASVLAMTSAVLIVGANIVFENGLNLNPATVTFNPIGVWTDADSTIEFRPDGTASFEFGRRYADRTKPRQGEGIWRLSGDFNISIVNSNATRSLPPLRVISMRDEFRLILEDFDDFDMWDNHLGFKKRL